MNALRKIAYTLLLLLIALPISAQRRERIGFYNVENLFDTINDPSVEDHQMLPLSDLEWNSEKYQRKIEAIARLIRDMDYPAIMGLAEVENRRVIEDILQQDELKHLPYDICHFDSPDKRGIDVALIFRSDSFRLSKAQAIRSKISHSTRDLLLVDGYLHDKPLSIIVVHLPSRIGGERFTEPSRIDGAKQIRALADSLIGQEADRGVIIMGDMNDNPKDRSLRLILRAQNRIRPKTELSDKALYLYNPFARLHRRGEGTTFYNGRWNMYDNIIVSGNLLNCDLGQRAIKHYNIRPYIFRNAALLGQNGKPLPTYKGSVYMGGISDHLPIYIEIGL